jgi:hypothetical protein
MQSMPPAVPTSVEVNAGAASPPAAVLVQMAARTCAVAVFGTSNRFVHPEEVAVAVTEVDAAHVTTATRRCPAVRGWLALQVPVTDPVALCVLTATPTG